jgi:hypothetical protein
VSLSFPILVKLLLFRRGAAGWMLAGVLLAEVHSEVFFMSLSQVINHRSRSFCNLLQSCFFVSFGLLTVGCNVQKSGLNSRTVENNLMSETSVLVGAEQILVRFTAADAKRLSKVLARPTIQPVPSPDAPDNQKATVEFGSDLGFSCAATSDASVSESCTMSINLKPLAAENFISSDMTSNEHMFHLRRAEDAKRLYSSLNVKEWDLQGSLYKRFSSADNRMILECILEGERSRCSVFLGNGQSDDLSD